MNKSYFRMLAQGGLVVKELNIDDTIIRKGTLREKYSVKEKKLVNNILHYVIQSNTSSDIILSEYAIEKDFIIIIHIYYFLNYFYFLILSINSKKFNTKVVSL